MRNVINVSSGNRIPLIVHSTLRQEMKEKTNISAKIYPITSENTREKTNKDDLKIETEEKFKRRSIVGSYFEQESKRNVGK